MQRLEFISRKAILFITWILIAFFVYGMGIVSILTPATREAALPMTPIALLLTTAVLLFFARTVYTRRMIFVFTAIALIGFLVELAGVQTGWIFGHYRYTSNFGVRWWGTPPLIGINWLFLSYAWAAVLQNTASAPVHRIVYAALGMLAYDLLLEQAAPRMQLWYWEKGNIPFSNYIAWFVLALFFQWLIRRNRIVTQNNMALPLLLLQIVLYISVILYI